VLIVDDNAEFREVLRDLVAATGGMTCVGEAASGETAVEAAAELSPELVIMDRRMPGIGGVEAARRITMHRGEVVVFLVSVERPHGDVLDGSGAAAFLDKRRLSSRVLTELWRMHGS
jgi:two-component system, NarL family, invasion response regulator UvrY